MYENIDRVLKLTKRYFISGPGDQYVKKYSREQSNSTWKILVLSSINESEKTRKCSTTSVIRLSLFACNCSFFLRYYCSPTIIWPIYWLCNKSCLHPSKHISLSQVVLSSFFVSDYTRTGFCQRIILINTLAAAPCEWRSYLPCRASRLVRRSREPQDCPQVWSLRCQVLLFE